MITPDLRTRLRMRRDEEVRAAFAAAWSGQDARLARIRGLAPVVVPESEPEPEIAPAHEAVEIPAVPVAAPPRRVPHRRRVRRAPAPGFGRALSQARTARGISQHGLAALAGIDASTLCRFELGQRHPSYAVLGRLADALGLDETNRIRLFAAAGMATGEPPVTDPRLRRIAALLDDPGVPAGIKRSIDHLLHAAILLGDAG